MQRMMIAVGHFFFRYRNRAFPFIVLVLYLLAPPSGDIFNSHQIERLKDALAIAIAFSGLALRGLVIGYAYIKRGGIGKRVYAENLVTEGMFGVCRNPLYLGNMLLYSGIFLMHGNPLVILLGISCYLFIYQCIILAEEGYLRKKFGAAYGAYCADVPRWLPAWSRFKASTDGMSFNILRVLRKDYPTIAITIVMLALTEMYEYISVAPANMGYLLFLIGLMAGTGIAALIVRTLKKKGYLAA